MIKAIFIDRDGVVNTYPGGVTKTDYVTDQKEFHFITGTLQALKILKDKGIKVIIASNQGGVNKGLYTQSELDKVNSFMLKEIEKAGGAIEEVFYCVHKDEDNCECRKPKPGMLAVAARKYGIDPKSTYFIGDTPKDISAGKRIGCKTVLVLSGKSSREEIAAWEDKPDHVFNNLLEAVKWLTNNKETK